MTKHDIDGISAIDREREERWSDSTANGAPKVKQSRQADPDEHSRNLGEFGYDPDEQ